jgi:hypothetical protein
MKVIFRCILAFAAICSSAFLLSNTNNLQAQSCCSENYCPEPPPNCPTPVCDYLGGCSYAWECDSPIVLDVKGVGFHLTDQANGVMFKFYGGSKQQVAWTDPAYGNAWLALDRNNNGSIDDASELFGNLTPQPSSPNRNGFLALAVYDLPKNGGNGDGFITAADSIFPHLLVWTDKNQNGISEPDELQTVAQAGFTSIALNYNAGHYKDQYGNIFRYHSQVGMDRLLFDHQVYDVYLVGVN